MAVHLTPAAVTRARHFITQDPSALGLRFGVKKTGCSGFGYVIDVAHERKDDDRIFEFGDVQLLIDAQSLAVVDGTEIDFVKQGLNATFVFRNPQVTAECGCGESFSVSKGAEF